VFQVFMVKSHSQKNASRSANIIQTNPGQGSSRCEEQTSGENKNESDEEDSEDDDFIYIPISDILAACGIEDENADGKEKALGVDETADQESQEGLDDSDDLSDGDSSDMLLDDENRITLPRHRTCGCDNINLIATTDVNNITDPEFRKLKLSTDSKLKKCGTSNLEVQFPRTSSTTLLVLFSSSACRSGGTVTTTRSKGSSI
jgi:hypothetical protein